MGIVNGLQKYEIIGYLESQDDIHFGENGHAYLNIKIISEFPASVDVFPWDGKIQVYVNNFAKYGFIDDEGDSEAKRRDNIQKFFVNRVISVQSMVTQSSEQSDRVYFQGKEPRIMEKNQQFQADDLLVAIPVFSAANATEDSQAAFEERLRQNKIVGKISNAFSPKQIDCPVAVIWKNTTTNQYTLYTGLNRFESMAPYGIKIYAKTLRAIDVATTAWFTAEYEFDNILYIPRSILKPAIDTAPILVGNTVAPVTTATPIQVKTTAATPITAMNADEEANFIDRFIAITRDKMHLYYAEQDLVNFHTAMKSDGLVILAGLSGTGKSRLVSAYAHALQLDDGQGNTSSPHVRFVPVRPFWADDADLLGYADLVNKVYRPGDSGLVDTLLAAQAHPNELFIIALDEMNLARVEHYFSQFLSVLEMDNEQRQITLYNQHLESCLSNSQQYPATIKIGDNVMFVGTINTDESTHQFSDKVLDRANVITLNMLPFDEINDLAATSFKVQVASRGAFNMAQYRGLKHQAQAFKLTNAERKMLWELHLLINQVDKNLGIGWRVVNQIDDFLTNLPQAETYLTRGQALDLQLVQRVLTKVKGSEEQLKDILDDKLQPGSLLTVLERYQDSSNFKKSREVIAQKAKELKVYGFTI